jgi:tetratricopeptide (TPR) repeat protein
MDGQKELAIMRYSILALLFLCILSTACTQDQDAVSYNNRGVAWAGKGEFDKAIADYTEAIRLDPKYAAAFYNRGMAWDDKGDNDKAIADYTEAIRLDPKLAAAYNNRGMAWEGRGG